MKSSSYYHKAEGNIINLPSPRKISGAGIRDEDLFQNVAYVKSLASQWRRVMKFAEPTELPQTLQAAGLTSLHLIFA